jgi:uncharacterized protein YjbI with pentapeptide repeats
VKWLPGLRDPGPPRLWRIGYALAVCFAAAVAGLVGLWLVALVLLNHPQLPHAKVISVHDTVGVAQLVFASVAGAGALVALVMAYRRQRVAEAANVLDRERWQATAAHDRTRLLNERFTTITTQLGSDQAAVRLAGVHAMAGLADDWEENRQTCIDVLCAYLRMPYAREPDREAQPGDRSWLAWRGFQEVRHTVIRVITSHLRPDAVTRWNDRDLDFTGVIFDGGDFSKAIFSSKVKFTDAEFSGGTVWFTGARFSGDTVYFDGAKFSGGKTDFSGAQFSGGTVYFDSATFSGGQVSFRGATFSGGHVGFNDTRFSGGDVILDGAQFSGGTVIFTGATFSGGQVIFTGATFSDGTVGFVSAEFSGSTVNFTGATFSGGEVNFGGATFSSDISRVRFDRARFCGGTVYFSGATFSGGQVGFTGATFSKGTVDFTGSTFSGSTVNFVGAAFSGGAVFFVDAEFRGGEISFGGGEFTGGTVDFHSVRDWSHPPTFDWDGTPPPGVLLPTQPSDSTS